MKKIELGQYITILASLGVIAGIVFLGIELQQNNDLLRQEADAVYFQNRVNLMQTLMEQGDLANIYAKASAQPHLIPRC